MSTKVYAVRVDKGSYDDWVRYVISVFDCPHKASEEKNRLIAHVKMMQVKYSKEEMDRLDDELYTDNPSKEAREFEDWAYNRGWSDWNTDSFDVVEYELNKTHELK